MIGTDYADLIQAYEGDEMRSDKSSDAEEVVREAHCSEGLFMIQVIVSPDVKADIASFSDNFFKFINAGKSWSCSVPSRSNGCGRRSKELGGNGAKISLGREWRKERTVHTVSIHIYCICSFASIINF